MSGASCAEQRWPRLPNSVFDGSGRRLKVWQMRHDHLALAGDGWYPRHAEACDDMVRAAHGHRDGAEPARGAAG